jgi:hypothetical protein
MLVETYSSLATSVVGMKVNLGFDMAGSTSTFHCFVVTLFSILNQVHPSKKAMAILNGFLNDTTMWNAFILVGYSC